MSGSEEALKRRAREVGEQRARVEAEIESISLLLQAPGQPGLNGSLVDKEGFPLASIDIPRVRADRHRLAVLHTEHKKLSQDLEAAIVAVHEAARLARQQKLGEGEGAAAPIREEHADAQAPGGAQNRGALNGVEAVASTSAPASGERASGAVSPFAVIDEVTAGSPGEEDGMRVGDQLLAFGSVRGVMGSSAVSAVAAELQRSEGQSVCVSVLRVGQLVELTVRPRRWSGRGLLGCHMQPLQP